MEKRILIIESGDVSFRGYILQALHLHGFKIVLLKQETPTWELRWIENSLIADFSQVPEVISMVGDYHKRKPILGVFTYIDLYVELTAVVSREFGLHFFSEETALHVRNKYLMRSKLLAHGLLQPAFKRYQGSLVEVADTIGFPSVIKPIAGHSSINVIKMTRDTNLSDIEVLLRSEERVVEWGITPEYMVEEYVEGREVSVESIIVQKEPIHLAVTDKFKSREPYFEEISHTVPSCLPDEKKHEIYELVTRGITALGVNNCAIHTEVKLSHNGLVIIEMGGRLGGDKIPYLVNLALGADMAVATAYASLGQKYAFKLTQQVTASIAFFVPQRQQVITETPQSLPPFEGIKEFEFWGERGQVVMAPPALFFTRLGFVVTTGNSYEQSRKRIEQCLQWLADETGIEYCIQINQ